MDKILAITGPTATGKTALGILLAKKFDGEIISADSRQVYKYMDIGTGKDKTEYGDVPVWGIDLVDPDYNYNVSEFVLFANQKIAEINLRGKLPIIVGGAGQYIKELFWPSETLDIKPDIGLRNKLSSYSVTSLQEELQKVNLGKWNMMNESDRQNPRRLIRAIEINKASNSNKNNKGSNIRPFIIGLTGDREIINKRIDERVDRRWPLMAEEITTLAKLGFNNLNTIGYREETPEAWKIAEHQYAKKQTNYLKKNIKGVCWFDVGTKNLLQEVQNVVQNYLGGGN